MRVLSFSSVSKVWIFFIESPYPNQSSGAKCRQTSGWPARSTRRHAASAATGAVPRPRGPGPPRKTTSPSGTATTHGLPGRSRIKVQIRQYTSPRASPSALRCPPTPRPFRRPPWRQNSRHRGLRPAGPRSRSPPSTGRRESWKRAVHAPGSGGHSRGKGWRREKWRGTRGPPGHRGKCPRSFFRPWRWWNWRYSGWRSARWRWGGCRRWAGRGRVGRGWWWRGRRLGLVEGWTRRWGPQGRACTFGRARFPLGTRCSWRARCSGTRGGSARTGRGPWHRVAWSRGKNFLFEIAHEKQTIWFEI